MSLLSQLAPDSFRSLAGIGLTLILCTVLSPQTVQAQSTYSVTNTNDTGSGSLRAAITNANDGSGTPADYIKFDISPSASPNAPHKIEVQSALPEITDPVIIKGPNHIENKPVIELDGDNAGNNADGLQIGSGTGSGTADVTVRRLAVVNFSREGLQFDTDGTVVITGCHVGVRADGTTQAGNRQGVTVASPDAMIGGPGSGDGNIISGNQSSGVISSGATVIQGNRIGIDANGNPMANGDTQFLSFPGISVSSSGNTIGGTGPGEGNIIAHNEGDGVEIRSSGGNTIRGNTMYGNGGIGIDLGIDLGPNIDDNNGQTSNDTGDPDTGPNNLQNFPKLQRADLSGGDVTVTYFVDSDPSASGSGTSAYPLKVDFYKADGDNDEGRAYLGTVTYTADDYNGVGNSTCSSGPCPKEVSVPPPADVTLTESDHIVATATDANSNTSEFNGQSSPLPVELASFDATQTGTETVKLTWTTASETNNAGFRIQKVKASRATGITSGPRDGSTSSSNENWATIGQINGAGTTSQSNTYTFTAQNLSTGTHQFRLKQVDLDGTTHVHTPTTVEMQMQKALRLSALAPNPARQQATLSFAVKETTEVRLTLFNVLGQKVATLFDGTPDAGETQTIDLQTEDLSSGTYLIRLQAGTHTQTKRLTVVR